MNGVRSTVPYWVVGGALALGGCDTAGGPGGAGGGSSTSTTVGSTTTGSSGGTFVHCDNSQKASKVCSIVPTKNAMEVSTAEQNCTSQGGTIVSVCPSAGLQGCCVLMGGGTCAYDPAFAPTVEANCPQSGGMWQTTPQ